MELVSVHSDTAEHNVRCMLLPVRLQVDTCTAGLSPSGGFPNCRLTHLAKLVATSAVRKCCPRAPLALCIGNYYSKSFKNSLLKMPKSFCIYLWASHTSQSCGQAPGTSHQKGFWGFPLPSSTLALLLLSSRLTSTLPTHSPLKEEFSL